MGRFIYIQPGVILPHVGVGYLSLYLSSLLGTLESMPFDRESSKEFNNEMEFTFVKLPL